MDSGVDYFNKRDYQKAIEALSKDLELANNDYEKGRILKMIGEAYKYLKQDEAASSKFKDALKAYFDALDAAQSNTEKLNILFDLVKLIGLDLGNTQQALKYANDAIEIDKNSYLSHWIMGIGLAIANKYSDSIKEIELGFSILKETNARDENEWYANYTLGFAYFSLAKEKDDLELYMKVLDMLPSIVDLTPDYYIRKTVCEWIGETYRDVEGYERSKEWFNKALEYAIDDNEKKEILHKLVEVYYFEGVFYFNKKEYDKAIQKLMDGLKIAPNDEDKAMLADEISGAYFMKKEYKDAINFENLALEYERDDAKKFSALLNISSFYLGLGNRNLAIEYGNKAFNIAKNDYNKARALENLVSIYHFIGDHEKVIDLGKKALQYAEAYPSIKFEIVSEIIDAYYWKKDYNSALEYAKEVQDLIEREGSFDRALFLMRLANIYNNMGDHNKATEYAKKAIDADKRIEIGAEKYLKKESKSESDSIAQSDRYGAEIPSLTFENVVDLDSLKKELTHRVIYPLQKPELISEYGFKGFGGLLLYGPPGCGKTMIVKATAGEAKIKLINIYIPDILNSYVGVTEKNIRDAFENARKSAPCILFFDEIDALLTNRLMAKYMWDISMVNVFLKELDDLGKSDEHVLVIGATNAPWLIDPAAKRPGRFDKLIYVPAPNKEVRMRLFSMYLKGKPLANDIDYEKLAEITIGYSSADIAMICNDATIQALDEAYKTGIKRPISMNDIILAISKTKPSLWEWYDTASKEIAESDKEVYKELVDEIKEYQKLHGENNQGMYR